MKLHHRSKESGQQGTVLLWSALLSFAVLTASVVFTTLSRSTHDMAQLHRSRTRADLLSEAASEYAIQAIETALNNYQEAPTQGTVDVDGLTVSYTVTTDGAVAAGTNSSGLTVYETTYNVEGIADWGDSHSRTRRVVNARRTPLFQFAMFWENDMEFCFPAEMEVTGPVHTNSRLFITSNNDFTFNTNYLGALKGIYNQDARTLKSGGSRAPEIRKWVSDPFDGSQIEEYFPLELRQDLAADGISSTSGYDSAFAGYDSEGDLDYYGSFDRLPFGPGAVEQWGPPDFYTGTGSGHTVQTEEHGLGTLVVPEIESFDMYTAGGQQDQEWDALADAYVSVPAGTGTHSKGAYHAQADLSIISWPDGSWKAYDILGTDVTSDVAPAVTATSIYDARQAEGSGQRVQLTSIDVAALGSTGRFPTNGLLYMGGYGAGTGTDALGFRVENGSELPGDLTVVSPNSVYVQGDYNTVNKKPAAVIADAVNLLSNAWDDSKTSGNLPSASSTTYNCSFVTGDVEEVGGVFQGSCMNALRRHERWSSRTEKIVGSIVCMFRSRYATGTYSNSGDYFRPPRRDWNYDTDLNSFANLPPFTPYSIEVSDVVSW